MRIGRTSAKAVSVAPAALLTTTTGARHPPCHIARVDSPRLTPVGISGEARRVAAGSCAKLDADLPSPPLAKAGAEATDMEVPCATLRHFSTAVLYYITVIVHKFVKFN